MITNTSSDLTAFLFLYFFSLERFEAAFPYGDFPKRSLSALFTTQKHLKNVRLQFDESSSGWDGDYMKSLTFRILESCPNLQELEMETHGQPLNLESNDLPHFFSLISKLKYLDIPPFNVTPHPRMQEVIQHLPELFNLTTLRLANSIQVNDDLCGALLERYCPSLQHLKLRKISDKLLQIIFKNLVSKLSRLCRA